MRVSLPPRGSHTNSTPRGAQSPGLCILKLQASARDACKLATHLAGDDTKVCVVSHRPLYKQVSSHSPSAQTCLTIYLLKSNSSVPSMRAILPCSSQLLIPRFAPQPQTLVSASVSAHELILLLLLPSRWPHCANSQLEIDLWRALCCCPRSCPTSLRRAAFVAYSMQFCCHFAAHWLIPAPVFTPRLRLSPTTLCEVYRMRP